MLKLTNNNTNRLSTCGDGVSKDHRLEWLDVSRKSSFGEKISKVINSAFVLVKYQDPRCYKKYNEIYKKAISQKGSLARAKLLSFTIIPGKGLTKNHQYEYKEIDRLKIRASEITKKKS